jgi:hypothetical protein
MFKSMAAGSIALLVAFVIQPATSQAGTDLDVSVGLHGYPVQYDSGYPARYPDYDDDDDEDDYDYISCSQGRRVVRNYGFRHIRILRCGGEIYKYQAIKRYRPWVVRVSARSGRIVSVRPARGYY